jgi:hypothetical protein
MKSELNNSVRINEAKPLIRRGYQALFVGAVLTIGLGMGAQRSMAQTTTTSAASTAVGAAAETTVPAAVSAATETTVPAVISTPSESTMVASDAASDSLPVGGIDAGFGGSSKGVSPVQVVALVGFVFVAAFAVGKFAGPSKAKTNQKKPQI